MIRALPLALLFHAMAARADTAADAAQRLVDFAHEGCAFMASQPEPQHQSHVGEPRIAAHFGRVLKAVDNDEGALRYLLSVPRFPHWRVEFHLRRVTMRPPPNVHIPLRELVRLLGKLQWPGDDYKIGQPSRVQNSWDFQQPANWPRCAMSVFSSLDGDDPLERHVVSFEFAN
jgi:hypothetical protein